MYPVGNVPFSPLNNSYDTENVENAFLEEVYIHSPNATQPRPKGTLLEQINECLQILLQSRYNIPSFKNFADAEYKLKSVRSCQEWCVGLVGIPLILLGGVIGTYIYVANDINIKISTPLALSLQAGMELIACGKKMEDLRYQLNNPLICMKIGNQLDQECMDKHMETRQHRQDELARTIHERKRLINVIFEQNNIISQTRTDGFIQGLPIFLLFVTALGICLCYGLHLVRKRESNLKEYRRSKHSLDECLKPKNILKVENLIQCLNIPPEHLSLENLIKELGIFKIREERKESCFLLRVSLREINFPKELIDLITVLSIKHELTIKDRFSFAR